MIDRIEKFSKITMDKQGPPQAVDIMAASCREASKNLDKIYNSINDEIIEHFKTFSDEIIDKYPDKRKMVASLLCLVGGVDNSLNLSSRSILSGQMNMKT